LRRRRSSRSIRIAQESLTNIARHARATEVTVSLEAGRDSVVLRVADDGRGFADEPREHGGLRIRDYVERGGGDQQFDVLTPRELEVLKLIAEANTSKEIAEKLFISIKTVDRHRQNILDKLGMRDRVELTRYAIRRGLIQP
jgi:DNA-binding CsgD family transcriptional regulator